MDRAEIKHAMTIEKLVSENFQILSFARMLSVCISDKRTGDTSVIIIQYMVVMK